MTDIKELFSGIGVVIDDEINSEKSTINKIAQSFRQANIPLLTYSSLPDENDIKSFHSVNFILLDWKWNNESSDETLTNDNVYFIKKLQEFIVCPIFIFTNESMDDIQYRLIENGVADKTHNSLILIKHKTEIDTSDKLFEALTSWLTHTPPAYVLKEWGRNHTLAFNSMFVDLYHCNHNWVNIMYKTTKKDGIDFSYELSDLLSENLRYRMNLLNIDTQYLRDVPDEGYSSNEIRDILQCQRFLPQEKLLSDMVHTGDIYTIEEDGKTLYFINVRPQCDCIPREGTIIDNVKLYLIQGEEKQIDKCHYDKKNGTFADIESRVTIFPINHKAIQFKLGNFDIKSYGEFKQYRIGKLLPPFITRLVQKFASYTQRQGLPRIPEDSTTFE